MITQEIIDFAAKHQVAPQEVEFQREIATTLETFICDDRPADYDELSWNLACLDLEDPGSFDLFSKLAYHVSIHPALTPEMAARAARKIGNLAIYVLEFNLNEAGCADDVLEATSNTFVRAE